MIKKLITIILIILISFNYLLADTSRLTLAKSLVVELKNDEKFKAYLLCLTEKGFVVWNSSYKSQLSDISKHAEYYTYDELEYFQVGGKMNFIPLAIGGVVILSQVVSIDEHEESIGVAIFSICAGLASILLTFVTMFIPRRYGSEKYLKRKKFPSKYISYKNDVPEELLEFIKEHEE